MAKPITDVTMGMFKIEALAHKWGKEDIAELPFDEGVTARRDWWRRCTQNQYRDVGIPYRCLIELYLKWKKVKIHPIVIPGLNNARAYAGGDLRGAGTPQKTTPSPHGDWVCGT